MRGWIVSRLAGTRLGEWLYKIVLDARACGVEKAMGGSMDEFFSSDVGAMTRRD